MKACFKCSVMKPMTEFYKHKGMSDGHLNKCKSCAKEDVKNNYKKNLTHYKEYERVRCKLPHRVIARDEYQRTTEGKYTTGKAKNKWIENNQIKRSATCKVNNAIRDGRLDKGSCCESCTATGRLHAHHDDYSRPLDIRWLCPKCHTSWHSVNGSGLNG